MTIALVKAALTNTYLVRAGEWWVTKTIYSTNPGQSLGNMTKIVVTTLNNSQ